MKSIIEKIVIRKNLTVKEAIRQMDEAGEKILFFVDETDRLLGTLTDGDIRRWIIKEGNLQDPVNRIYKKTPLVMPENYDLAEVKEIMTRKKIDAIPVVDRDNRLKDVLIWNKIFQGEGKRAHQAINVPVLIMAGGKGTRLDPFTKILPKPLIPFGDKPILEIIMDRFAEYGCDDFYLTVNYKGKMIQAYFDNAECQHRIHYVWEETPCGTAGSLKLAEGDLKSDHIFVSNCDILIKSDYSDLYHFHIQNNYDITVVGSMQHVSVPYGVLEMKNGGTLTNIIEKPEYDFFVNTGLYLIKKEVMKHIPLNVKFDFPDLILKVKEAGGRVGVYPISQQSWVDIGQWQEYHNAVKKLEG